MIKVSKKFSKQQLLGCNGVFVFKNSLTFEGKLARVEAEGGVIDHDDTYKYSEIEIHEKKMLDMAKKIESNISEINLTTQNLIVREIDKSLEAGGFLGSSDNSGESTSGYTRPDKPISILEYLRIIDRELNRLGDISSAVNVIGEGSVSNVFYSGKKENLKQDLQEYQEKLSELDEILNSLTKKIQDLDLLVLSSSANSDENWSFHNDAAEKMIEGRIRNLERKKKSAKDLDLELYSQQIWELSSKLDLHRKEKKIFFDILQACNAKLLAPPLATLPSGSEKSSAKKKQISIENIEVRKGSQDNTYIINTLEKPKSKKIISFDLNNGEIISFFESIGCVKEVNTEAYRGVSGNINVAFDPENKSRQKAFREIRDSDLIPQMQSMYFQIDNNNDHFSHCFNRKGVQLDEDSHLIGIFISREPGSVYDKLGSDVLSNVENLFPHEREKMRALNLLGNNIISLAVYNDKLHYLEFKGVEINKNILGAMKAEFDNDLVKKLDHLKDIHLSFLRIKDNKITSVVIKGIDKDSINKLIAVFKGEKLLKYLENIADILPNELVKGVGVENGLVYVSTVRQIKYNDSDSTDCANSGDSEKISQFINAIRTSNSSELN